MSSKKKFLRFVELAYLLVAAIFIIETIIAFQNDKPRWWLSLLLSIVAIAMYFFKKHFRKKMDKNKNN
jgi:c-di-AMP phosphodiesterase-like protein